MNAPNPCSNCCWVTVGLILAWWLVASTLLWLTWNRVIGALTRVKTAKLWQSLLLVATIVTFVLPCVMLKKKMHDRRCSYSRDCHPCEKSEKKDHCPYSKRSEAVHEGAFKETEAE